MLLCDVIDIDGHSVGVFYLILHHYQKLICWLRKFGKGEGRGRQQLHWKLAMVGTEILKKSWNHVRLSCHQVVSKGWLDLIKKHLKHNFQTSWNLNSASHSLVAI